VAARPGRLRLYPYQRRLIDVLADPGAAADVTVMASAQSGKSEAVRSALYYWIAQDPGPIRLAYPDQTAAESIMSRYVMPCAEACPPVAALLPRRRKLLEVSFSTCDLVAAWAGSPQRLASDPVRYAVSEELDKWPAWSGKDASPQALLEARTKTFGDRAKRVRVSTPTYVGAPIHAGFHAAASRLRWNVRCPSCGLLSPLAWSGVRWQVEGAWSSPPEAPRDSSGRMDLAAALELLPADSAVARLDCGHDLDDRERPAAVREGAWVGDGAADPRSVAFHFSDLIALHPSGGITSTLVRWLRAVSPSRRMEWTNQVIGEPWSEEGLAVEEHNVAARVCAPDGIVPRWATLLVVTVDVQADCCWYVVRAWGKGQRSRGIAWGRLDDLDDAPDLLKARYPIEGTDREISPHALGIDVGGGGRGQDGSRSMDVRRIAGRHRGMIPVKGEARDPVAHPPHRMTRVPVDGIDQETVLINVSAWKDVVARSIIQDDPVAWEEPESARSRTYLRQVASELKILERSARGERWVWRPRSDHHPNHLWDCLVYSACLADVLGAERRRPILDLARQKQAPPPKGGSDWLEGWV